MSDALIIDDNRNTADALNQMLSVLGFNSRVAYGPRSAINTLKNEFTPEFVCLDINMPGVDGTEILAYLRREPRLKLVPVFIVTSDDQSETRKRVMQLGATGIIIKPVTIDMLENILKRAKLLK